MPEPGSPEWHARVARLLAEEARQPLGWWYLSFAVPDKFLGGAYIQARGMVSAMKRSSALGINPGNCEIAYVQIPPESEHLIPQGQKHRETDDWIIAENWVSEEQRVKAIATNELWELQWYPDTPVGFCLKVAADLDVLLDWCREYVAMQSRENPEPIEPDRSGYPGS